MDYYSEAGNNLIEKWYSELNEGAQSDFDTTLNNLTGINDWHGLKEFKMLHGKHSGLGEIRFKSGNVQYRAVGFFGPGRGDFTLLVGCEKRQRVFRPADAFDLALRRKRLCGQGRGTLHEHSF